MIRAYWLPIGSLWRREIVRFARQRSRLLGAFLQPVVFWVLLGAGMTASFRPAADAGGPDYVEYFYPGVIVMVLLFTAIFSTISTVEDRQSGFLQGVLVAPLSRGQIVLGQAAGGTTLAVLQGVLLLLLAPLAGIELTAASVALAVAIMTLLGFSLTSLGLVIAWRMESTQGFHAVMNLILMPIWFLSGAFFPPGGVPEWLAWVMRSNPLTYGLAALRRALYWHEPGAVAALPGMAASVAVSLAFALAAWVAASAVARRAVT